MCRVSESAGADKVGRGGIPCPYRDWFCEDFAYTVGPPLSQLLTPDRRYLIVRGRLWRASNPHLSAERKEALVRQLMDARRLVKTALSAKDSATLAAAREAVHAAKVALGERGPVWWSDGTQDFNRYLVKNSPYAAWYDNATRG
jgi:hypothetical protein